MNLENQRKLIDNLGKNLYAHERDKKRFLKELQEKYDLERNDIEDHLYELESKRKKIQREIDGLEKKSSKMLKDVRDALL